MRTDLSWISRRKYFVAPVIFLVLILSIAACGSSATGLPEDSQSVSNVVPSASKADDAAAKEAEAMAMEAEKKEAEAMAMEAERKEAEAMAMEAEKKEAEAMEKSGGSLKLDPSGVEPLANGYHFEGWAIIGGSPVSTGKFNIGVDGDLVALDGKIKSGGVFHSVPGLETATDVVITIEPAGDTDDVPTATHYLAGSLSNGNAALSIGHAAALGTDFSSASGVYILATPTDGAENNENSGIWFLDLASGSPEVGLDLPTLREGWLYEGWAVIDGVPVSSGRFTKADEVDFDDPSSGTEGGPPFPGEDYLHDAPATLSFPTDLSGGTAVISVEPSPDDSSAPFTLKPLVGAISMDAIDHKTYQLENNANGLPSGSAVVGKF